MLIMDIITWESARSAEVTNLEQKRRFLKG